MPDTPALPTSEIDRVSSVRSTGVRWRSWSASSVTSTSPRRRSRTRSQRLCNGGRLPDRRRAPRDGSSQPPETGRSTASAARRPGTTRGLDLDGYHVFHAIRADLLRRLGRDAEAAQAYDAAITRTENATERDFLRRRRRRR
jgi:hypothetical protein